MSAPENRRLSSWNQIARYLGRDRRTVMRWEKRWGMPVRRPGGEARGSTVYAFTAELDAWLERAGPHAQDEDGRDEGPNGGEGGRFPPLAVALGAGAVVVLVGFLGWVRYSKPEPPPSQVVAAGDVMTVLAVDGSVVWTYRHPEGHTFHDPGHIERFVDLDGDGANELLLGINTVSPVDEASSRGELFAFGSDRSLAWRVVAGDSLTFGAGMFGPPWSFRSFDLMPLNGEARIVVRVEHATWWPSILTLLTVDGTRVGRFVNSGWLLDAGILPRTEGDLLLVGGISNSRGGAMLAVLDPRDLDAASPEDEGPFECLTCPSGRPLRYFVFAPSHVNTASSLPYNRTVSIETTESGFKVVAMEGRPGSEVHWVYEFSREMELVRASPGDTYWPWHERLRSEGLLDHGEDECPERDGSPTVSMWTPDAGWQTVRPAVSEITAS